MSGRWRARRPVTTPICPEPGCGRAATHEVVYDDPAEGVSLISGHGVLRCFAHAVDRAAEINGTYADAVAALNPEAEA